ncbi:MAG: porin family protein [Chitinophagaceae bacterium]
MKYSFLLLCSCFIQTIVTAQLGLGLKAGLNFANVTSTAGISTSNKTGYMIGAYLGARPKKLFGFRSELILSRQGYDYKTNTNTGQVNLDYLLLPQIITLNFGKKIQLHAGGQAAFLLNAGVDSTSGNSSGSLFDYFKRFDYGVVAGAEISPISGFFIGGRINVSFADANEEAPIGGNWPNFIPRLSAKNNVVQLYAGWRF